MESRRFASVAIKTFVMVSLLALVAGGCGGSAATVTVARVGYRAIEQTVTVAGTLQATSPAQVIPRVYGSVSELMAQEGQYVHAGQPLVQLDTSQLEQSLLSAQAGLESTRSLAAMFTSLSSSASGMGAATVSALASIDAGVTNLYALEKLLVPSLPEDQRLPALQAIEASYQQYQSEVARRPAFEFGGGGGYGTGSQEAAARKAIDNARKDLEAATIVAPASGTLVAVTEGGASLSSMMSSLMGSLGGMIPSGLNLAALSGLSGGLGSMGLPTGGPPVPGTFVMPGSPIYQIVDLKGMSMLAKVDETDIARVLPAQAATVSLEAYQGKKYRGTVYRVADVATTNEAGATAFDVTVRLDPSDINLKIGMTGTATITTATKPSAIAVPVEAIVEKKGRKHVFRVVDGRARLTAVTTGIQNETSVEILSGVKAGDRVVTGGIEKLKDGQAVKK